MNNAIQMKNNSKLIILYFFILSCGEKNESENLVNGKWQTVEINSDINNNLNFKRWYLRKNFQFNLTVLFYRAKQITYYFFQMKK